MKQYKPDINTAISFPDLDYVILCQSINALDNKYFLKVEPEFI